MFNEIVVKLKFEKFFEALPLLAELDKMDPNNPNLKYLTGVCYAATNTEKEKALELLEYAVKYNSSDYNPSYYKERKSPIYALYYLGIVYTYFDRCDDAKKVFNEFIGIVSDGGNDYVEDSKFRMNECFKKNSPAVLIKKDTIAPAATITITEVKVAKKNPELAKTLKTKKIVFHGNDPFYAVQVGAFSQSLPASNSFPGMQNVKSFIDKEGMIRYVVGGNNNRANAQYLLESVMNMGYKDAFIVDISEKAKFEEEVLNKFKPVQYSPAKQWAKLEYKVQVGAYKTREKMSEELAQKSLKIAGITEIEDVDKVLLTVGSFKMYDDAKKFRDMLIQQGMNDSFIIVYKNGVKISTKEAAEFYNKD